MLIPRQAAIDKLTHVNKTIISLYALEDVQTKAEVRGKKRVTIAETEPLTVCCNLYNLPIIQLVEKNPQMPPCCVLCTNGGITGRKKSANAAVVY
jgi:hypothetical protein